MYGLINKAVKKLVVENFGQEKWEQILKKSGLDSDKFSAMETYPDSTTYDLVGAASEVLEVPAEKVLELFGLNWPSFTSSEGFGELLDMFGSDFMDAVQNLNHLHDRMGLTMPDLNPPKFDFKNQKEDSITLIYISERPGLAPMMVGLLQGLATKHDVKIDVKHRPKSDTLVNDHFDIKMIAA